MRLTFRPAVMGDFDAFFRAIFGGAQKLLDIIEYEWRLFLLHSPDLSMVVEDLDQAPEHRLVGFAQTVFVTDTFVRHVQSGLPPHINQHATHTLPDGSWPLLTVDQIGPANAGDGLNALTTRWGWHAREGNAEAHLQLRSFIDRSYAHFYRGYRYKYLLMPAYGEMAREALLNAGYSLLTDYSDYYRQHPIEESGEIRAYALHVSRDEALSREGTLVSRIFDFAPPRFGFRPHEQELLRAALLGKSDRQGAERLSVGLDAIKKRWDSIYQRVRERDPDLLPDGGEGGRGAEKRGRLLTYLRGHLSRSAKVILQITVRCATRNCPIGRQPFAALPGLVGFSGT
jgi:hypothetical protein